MVRSQTTIVEDDGDFIQILEENNSGEKDEGEAVKQFEKERELFLERPNQHPRYGAMWTSFWHKKRREFSARAIDIETVDLTPEWRKIWEDFVADETEKKIAAKKSDQAWATTSRSETIVLSDSDSSETTPSASSQEVKVLNLLHLLAQLNSRHLLAVGEDINQLRDLAFTMETKNYGSSQLLIDNDQCFNLMDRAAESLKLKVRERKVAEPDSPVVKIALQQISIFLNQSRCEKSDILELDSELTPGLQDDSKVLRMSIAKTIEKEVERSGRRVSQPELDSLVEAEYRRVKYKIPNNDYSKYLSLQPAGPASQSDLFSAYSSTLSQPGIDWANVMKGVTNIQRSAHVPQYSGANPPAQRQTKPWAESEMLSDGELAALMNNFDQLKDDEKNKLIACMGELEALDPRKVERIKRIIFQNR